MHLTHHLTQGLTHHLTRRWFRPTRRALAPITRRVHRHDDAVLAEDEPLLGCGWFDSSHELMRGLVIVETEAPMRFALGSVADDRAVGRVPVALRAPSDRLKLEVVVDDQRRMV